MNLGKTSRDSNIQFYSVAKAVVAERFGPDAKDVKDMLVFATAYIPFSLTVY